MQRMLVTMPVRREGRSWVYCPICTHTVEAAVIWVGKKAMVKPGERCPRCQASLDAGRVLRDRAAAA
jgi:hypothetical protein